MSTLVTPVSLAANGELAVLALIEILTLFALMVGKEMLMGSGRWQSPLIQRMFNIALIPLGLIFAIMVFHRMIEILG